LVSCIDLDSEDIRHILELVLYEFPVRETRISLPEWTTALDGDHRIKVSLLADIKSCADKISKAGDVKGAFDSLLDNEYVKSSTVDKIDLGTGCVSLSISLKDGLYYDIISELTGFEIGGEQDLISLLKSLASIKERYDKIESALDEAEERGYGIVMPSINELTLEEKV
jgi:stage IV sporulation protein A